MTVTDRAGVTLQQGDYVLVHEDDGSHSEFFFMTGAPAAEDGHTLGLSHGWLPMQVDDWYRPEDVEFVDRPDKRSPQLTAREGSGPT